MNTKLFLSSMWQEILSDHKKVIGIVMVSIVLGLFDYSYAGFKPTDDLNDWLSTILSICFGLSLIILVMVLFKSAYRAGLKIEENKSL